MGQWMRDGSYQYDEDDIRAREHETQGQQWERRQRSIAAMERADAINKAKAEANKNFEHMVQLEDRIIERERNEQKEKEIIKDLNNRNYNVKYWLKYNSFSILKNTINGKLKKYEELATTYKQATKEEEKRRIVVEMEKLIPIKRRNSESRERTR